MVNGREGCGLGEGVSGVNGESIHGGNRWGELDRAADEGGGGLEWIGRDGEVEVGECCGVGVRAFEGKFGKGGGGVGKAALVAILVPILGGAFLIFGNQ